MENQPDTSTPEPTKIKNDRDDLNTSSKWIRLFNQTGETIIPKESGRLNFALNIASHIASLFALFIGLIVLIGWTFDIASFKSVFPHLATMKANAALAFLLSGTSLWLSQTTSKSRLAIARILAAVVALIGLLTLSEYLLGVDFKIDQLIFKGDETIGVPFPGRMSPATAFNFAIIGFSLFFLIKKDSLINRKAQWVAAIAVLISLLALIGYAYGIQSLYRIPPFSSMALHTAFAFYLLFIGIVFAQPTQGIMAIILKRSIGGILARRLIPAALIIPFVIGWFRLKAEQAGYFTTEFGVALSTTFNITIFTTLVLLVARSLDKTETERKRMVEKLRDSEARYRTVIETASDAIITVDQNSKIQFANSSAKKIFGYTIEELLGQQLTMLMPVHLQDVHLAGLKRYIDTGHRHISWNNVELPGLHKNGQEISLEVSFGEFNKTGQRFFTGTLRDITERKLAEAKLREQAQILDLAPVLIHDINHRIVFWNTGAEMMYGWKQDETIGELSHNLLQTEFPKPLEEIRDFFLANGYWEGELIHTKRNGERIVVASQWVLHKNENGEPKAILEINKDITERRRAEEQIQRLNEELEHRVIERTKQLESANKELEAFSYSVSHDLRAPLRAINGFSQALSEDYEDIIDDEGKNFLQEIRNASKDMAQLIDDMLQLARVSRSEMRNEQINLGDIVNSIVNQLQKSNPDYEVTIKIEDGLIANGDQRLLKVMLSNLLGNAWKFTSKRENAEIIFGHEVIDGEMVYFVRDNGVGFDMQYADKLFGVFQRLHSVGEFEGTGVGLATVQRILNRHGGRVWAEGKVNQGATFYFTIPIIE